MGVWSCVDGNTNEQWEYQSLEIRKELLAIQSAVCVRLEPSTDTSTWTTIISGRLTEATREEVVAEAPALVPTIIPIRTA